MDWLYALAGALALLALGTALGLLWRVGTGRARTVGAAGSAERVRPSELADAAGIPPAFGSRATLLQFSTEYCARCPQTRQLLQGVAAELPGVAAVEVDLGARPELARRFSVMQTPTVLLLDADGAVRARIGGAPARSTLSTALEPLLSAPSNQTGEPHAAQLR